MLRPDLYLQALCEKNDNPQADGDISVNMYISDTNIENIMSTKESLKCMARRLVGRRSYMSKKEFEYRARSLYKCCLKGVRDMHELHRRRVTGMQIIDDIILRVDPNYVSAPHVILIIWSIMSCIHHFQLRLRIGSSGLVQFTRQRKATQCFESYGKLIRLLRPTMYRIILHSIITFYKEGQLWEIEFACTDLVMKLLKIYGDIEEPIHDMLNLAIQASSVKNEVEAKRLIQVIYELLKEIKWRSMSETLMIKLMSMFISSICPREDEKDTYVPLRRGLELCIRNAICNLQNVDLLNMLSIIIQRIDGEKMDEEPLLDLGNIAVLAASRYNVKTFYQNIKPSFLEDLFAMNNSGNSVVVFVSARIWLNLIDRQNNMAKLRTPRMFFKDCDYHIVIKKCSRHDKLFFKEDRKKAYRVALQSFSHSFKVCEVETVFQSCALTIVEIPCGHTASSYAATAMSLQEYAFKLSTDNLVRSHHLHATVLSMLSLICYVHKADVLYKYILTIMQRRAGSAPHLNPPLKPTYQYAQHHILWNKPELFFEDWEVRYGLWKCFRQNKKRQIRR